jgi:hypothetical protein
MAAQRPTEKIGELKAKQAGHNNGEFNTQPKNTVRSTHTRKILRAQLPTGQKTNSKPNPQNMASFLPNHPNIRRIILEPENIGEVNAQLEKI